MPTRILIIEDNPENLELMRYLLDAHGYAVSAERSGEAGIARASREKPDLIMCDIQMPGIDGYEVARRLKSNPETKGIKIIAVTALAMVGDRDRVLAAGFDGYISKPIAPESFVQQINAFLPPALRSGLKQRTESVPGAAQVNSQRGIILVVDNLRMNLDLAESLLGASGYTVITAAGMYEGIERAQTSDPDLIMSDVGMADGTGFDFLSMVKADPRLRAIPFILITSTAATERERAKGLALGATRYLFRPIDPKILLDEIEASLKETRRV